MSVTITAADQRKLAPILAAVESCVKHNAADLWAIGDAVLKVCGPPDTRRRATSGSWITKAAQLCKQNGWPDFTAKYLGNLRMVAHRFLPHQRHRNLSVSTHAEAQDPDFLNWLVEDRGTNISKRDCRTMRARWRQVERQRRDEARREAEAEERRARTPAERTRARERVEDLRGPPTARPQIGRPDQRTQHQLRNLSAYIDAERELEAANAKVRNSLASIREMTEINQAYVDGYVEECQRIIEAATQIVNYLRQARFTVIEGGRSA